MLSNLLTVTSSVIHARTPEQSRRAHRIGTSSRRILTDDEVLANARETLRPSTSEPAAAETSTSNPSLNPQPEIAHTQQQNSAIDVADTAPKLTSCVNEGDVVGISSHSCPDLAVGNSRGGETVLACAGAAAVGSTSLVADRVRELTASLRTTLLVARQCAGEQWLRFLASAHGLFLFAAHIASEVQVQFSKRAKKLFLLYNRATDVLIAAIIRSYERGSEFTRKSLEASPSWKLLGVAAVAAILAFLLHRQQKSAIESSQFAREEPKISGEEHAISSQSFDFTPRSPEYSPASAARRCRSREQKCDPNFESGTDAGSPFRASRARSLEYSDADSEISRNNSISPQRKARSYTYSHKPQVRDLNGRELDVDRQAQELMEMFTQRA